MIWLAVLLLRLRRCRLERFTLGRFDRQHSLELDRILAALEALGAGR